MEEYPKIETLFVRDYKTHKVINGEWRLPEFNYLKDNLWLMTEKVDGTNVRVLWDGKEIRFGGRTDNAQMPTFLLARLQELFSPTIMLEAFGEEGEVCLYGEGFGARIQKGGGNYIAEGVDFMLFDVKIGRWWLEQANVWGIAEKLGIIHAPVVAHLPLENAISLVRSGLNSHWGDFPVEGLVVRPDVDLWNRKGQRIIGKIKSRDF